MSKEPQPKRRTPVRVLAAIERQDRILLAVAVILTIVAGALTAAHANAVLTFALSGASLAFLAALVGQATEQVGTRLGPGATGVLQSGIGNLPELFVGIFALRAGLLNVVQAALVGSILGNSLLVLGLAFLVGGLRHGTQRFHAEPPRLMGMLTLLAVSALIIPTLAHALRTNAAPHIEALSVGCAVVLLVVFLASLPMALNGGPVAVPEPGEDASDVPQPWPMWLAIALLVLAGGGSAFVSDWFVSALSPAIAVLHISPGFTGLVIVALAGNAVENVVGVQLAAANKPDYAISVILNSSLQVALGLFPVLVLLSFVIGGAHLTLVLPGLLVVALFLSGLLGTIIVYDGESTWIEGVALIGLYCIIAFAFWWG